MRRLFLVVAITLLAPAARAAEAPWVSLFDGKTLNGWVKRGGAARYEVKDGAIVGTTVPNTKNTFLCTEKTYGDFVLELEFKVDAALNSGVQIRGQSRPDYQDGRVHGLQVEIDQNLKRMWTGGLYDEGRRGWLNDLTKNEAAQKAYKPGEWNKFRVEAIGESVKTWVNGVPAADLVDSFDLEGFVALQVHQVGKKEEPFHVAWRNIRLQDLGRHVWRPLWDGKSIKGFKAAGGGAWIVKEGILTGLMRKTPRVDRLTMEGPSTRNGLLFTEKPLGDFTTRLEYRILAGNSGLYFRSEQAAWPVGAKGPQVDLDPAGSGGLYETGGRGWVARSPAVDPKKKPKPEDWQTVTVSAHGGRVLVYANGMRVADLPEAPGEREGKLGLELIAGQDVKLEVRKLELLSEAIPPPVPGKPIGWCIRAVGSAPDDAKTAGFEYVELALQDVLSMSDEDFDKAVARFAALGVPATVGYNIVPADLLLVGPDADKAKQDQHLARALGRAKRLGLKMVVLNNGPARKVPEGFAADKAWKQLVDFGRRFAAEAKKNDITVLIQPLRPEETNLVTNVPDAVKLVKAVARPNFQLLVDYSFMAMQNEDLAVLQKAKGHLKHVWISNPNGRTYPMNADEADYPAFFTALKKIGYKGGVSIHARTDNFFADAPPAMAFLRKMAAEKL